MSEEPKYSPVDLLKRESQYLRGTLTEELATPEDHFNKDNANLLKHFGTYQQDNRDERSGGEKSYFFMVRTRIPGGRLTSEQLLAELDLCDELGNNTLRITTRQGLQLHGVLKRNLQRTIQRIDEVQLATLGACGDVNRNVMCCPAPYDNPIYRDMQTFAAQIADHFAPRGGAYHEIWLRNPGTGEERLVAGGNGSTAGRRAAPTKEVLPSLIAERPGNPLAGDEREPIYGKQYLPRKFKMAIGLPEDNCVDVYTNDLGFLAIHREGRILGYNLLAGGGQGMTPSAKKTFPALAKRLCFVTPDQALAVTEAVVKVQRDFGNREDRKVARLKYVIAGWGIEKFKEKVEEYYGAKLADPHPDDVHGFNDHLGWDEQGDGRWFYGLNVENGRIKDVGDFRLKTALREICTTLKPGIRLTSHQSILFTDIAPEHKARLETILTSHGVKLSHEISNVRRWSMACVAWPTCGLSITEAERALPGMIDQLETEIARLGLAAEQFTIRMTGCPNGCARPYNSDIGLVGKTKDKYSIYVGGQLLGKRLNTIYKDIVHHDDVVRELVPLFAYFKQARQSGETFGDFCHRVGTAELLAYSERFLAAPAAS